MTQTDGEKELVLGNKQLISLFFVVVALCGVFFAMGYMIGRNSTKTALSGTSGDAAAGSTPAARQDPEPPRETAAPAGADSPSTPAETRPAQDVPAAPVPSAAERAPERRATETKAGESKAAEARDDKITVAKTEAGASYLQVTALPRGDAESVVRTLREQRFPTLLAESSKDGLYRVLVGPYHQTSQLAESKARLKTLGFASAFVQKQ